MVVGRRNRSVVGSKEIFPKHSDLLSNVFNIITVRYQIDCSFACSLKQLLSTSGLREASSEPHVLEQGGSKTRASVQNL